jgi:hypothetical protein
VQGKLGGLIHFLNTRFGAKFVLHADEVGCVVRMAASDDEVNVCMGGILFETVKFLHGGHIHCMRYKYDHDSESFVAVTEELPL